MSIRVFRGLVTADRKRRFRAVTDGDLIVDRVVELSLQYTAPSHGFKQGGSLWIFNDFRQFSSQFRSYLAQGGISVSSPNGSEWIAHKLNWSGSIRTLDLVPEIPEFLNALHITCAAGELRPDEIVEIHLRTAPTGYKLPQNAIEAFYFWAVEDPSNEIEFVQSREDRAGYYYFHPRTESPRILRSNPLSVRPGPPTAFRVVCPSLSERQTHVRIHAEDEFGNPAKYRGGPVRLESAAERIEIDGMEERGTRAEIRLNHGIDSVRASAASLRGESNPARVAEHISPSRLYWGELHGMVFNQRPYREHFEWARDVASLDFSAGQLFSYLTCVDETWEEMKQVWDEFEVPGEFISIPAVEYGTPPDGSHRIGFFPSTRDLPPLFCEVRRGAHDPRLVAKFSRETIYCRDYRSLYDEVHKLGGIVHGHYHTLFYEGETLAEIYQKQQFDVDAEEEKINKHLRAGMKLGIVGGTDTHDSRPGNPFPEPGPARPGGLTGVWAEKLDRRSILDALKDRRTYATTGVRMIIEFQINGRPMGSTVEAGDLEVSVHAAGTEKIARVELVENGLATTIAEPFSQEVDLSHQLGHRAQRLDQPEYCYLRLLQVDGNKAWTSPIWIDG